MPRLYKYTGEKLLALARELANTYGESLTLTAFRRETGLSPGAAGGRFGLPVFGGRFTPYRTGESKPSPVAPDAARWIALRLHIQLDVQITNLPRVDFGGGAGHWVGGFLGLGEGDHVADVVAAGEHHDPAVEAQGDAAVGGGAVAEGVEEEAEALFGLFFFDVHQVEDPLLDLRIVDADAAAGGFVAVADEVVRRSPDAAGVGGEVLLVVGVDRAERVVLGVPALLVVVPAEQREVEDPEDLHRVRIE